MKVVQLSNKIIPNARRENYKNLTIKQNIRGSGWTTKSMDRAHFGGRTIQCIKDFGKITKNMGKVHL